MIVHAKLVSIAVIVADSTLVAFALQLPTAHAVSAPSEWTPAAVTTLLAAVTAMVVTILSAIQAKTARVAAAESAAAVERKADTIVEKTTEIHTAANSTLAKATAALELARMEFKGLQDSTSAEIAGLKQQIVIMNEARTAAVAATTPATVPLQVAHQESELESVKVIVEDTNKVVNEELKKP